MKTPEYKKNAQRKHPGALEIEAPELDTDESVESDSEKTAVDLFVEQQWRDVAGSEVAKLHPLSLNRDAEQVKN